MPNTKLTQNFNTHFKALQDEEADRQFQMKSCTPDKPETFIGRDVEVKKIVSSLVEKDCGVVSIVGGPGFGKSTVAVEVAHHLINEHDIVVIFSFLSHASTVPEVRIRLCHDVGVIPGKDSESSLMLWLRSIEKNVVLVMDNIEQLLESHAKSQFIELVRTLRKNSQKHLQVLTTTRTEFSIPGLTTANHQIKQLDEISSVELLKKWCPDHVKDAHLSELAKLCGFVPLALCIAGTIIPDLDDPSELIQWLRDKPMKTLRNSDQCVQQAIEFSFQKLSDEDRRGLVCLSVFGGNFQKKSAEEVTEKDGIKTQGLLRNLVNRSLVQKSSGKRYVIHSLIRRFLADHDQFHDEKAMAQALMVKCFLKMCHLFTMKCYSYNGFTSARELLKKDIHNVEETLKICSRDQANNLSPIFDFLASSDIYKSSSRYFYNISWDLLPETVLNKFFKSCIKLAESRQQPTVKITFQCHVADQEGRKSGWKSPEYVDRMKGIRAAFHEHKAKLKDERSLFKFCYYFLARYDSNKTTTNAPVTDFSKDDLLPFPDDEEPSIIEEAAKAHVLMERGNLSKKRAEKVPHKDKKYLEYIKDAHSFYEEALRGAETVLGDHELTCVLYKLLGDLCLDLHKNDVALTYYSNGKDLRKKLELDSNEAFVFLLKNYGACLYYLRRFDESVETLKKSLDIADKLADKPTVCKSRVYFVLAKAYRDWKPDCQEAAGYAKQAMEMQELLDSYMIEKLKKIIQTAEENTAKSE